MLELVHVAGSPRRNAEEQSRVVLEEGLHGLGERGRLGRQGVIVIPSGVPTRFFFFDRQKRLIEGRPSGSIPQAFSAWHLTFSFVTVSRRMSFGVHWSPVTVSFSYR